MGPKEYVTIAEHRLVAGAQKGDIVHHHDGNPANNDPDNPLLVRAHDEAVASMYCRGRELVRANGPADIGNTLSSNVDATLATMLTAVDTALSDPSHPRGSGSRQGRRPVSGAAVCHPVAGLSDRQHRGSADRGVSVMTDEDARRRRRP